MNVTETYEALKKEPETNPDYYDGSFEPIDRVLYGDFNYGRY